MRICLRLVNHFYLVHLVYVHTKLYSEAETLCFCCSVGFGENPALYFLLFLGLASLLAPAYSLRGITIILQEKRTSWSEISKLLWSWLSKLWLSWHSITLKHVQESSQTIMCWLTALNMKSLVKYYYVTCTKKMERKWEGRAPQFNGMKTKVTQLFFFYMFIIIIKMYFIF